MRDRTTGPAFRLGTRPRLQASRLEKSTVRKRLAMLGSAPIRNAKPPIRTRRSTISQEKSESSEMNNSGSAADLNLSKRRVALRLATLAWAVLVFYLSTERFGSDFSHGLV